MTDHQGSPVRFGLIGAGNIAVHAIAPAIHASPGAELVAAAARDIERAKALGAKRAYDSYDAIFEDPEVDAVYLASHNGLHFPQACAALEAGKHVLCEKPLVMNADQAEELYHRADREKRVLMEGFMYRYHPQIARLRALLADGAVGVVKVVEACFSFHMEKRVETRMRAEWGGGALLDVGCYCVNFARLVYGKPPASVIARGTFCSNSGVDLALHGLLDYGNGRCAMISCGFDAGMRNWTRVTGQRGTITLESAFANSNRPVRMVMVKDGEEYVESFEPVNVFEREISDFATAIQAGGKPMLDSAEGWRNSLVMDALLASAHCSGQTVAVEQRRGGDG